MILLKTALMDLKKNIIMNLITILEMTATIIVLLIMISSIFIKYEYYAPFKDLFQSNGLYCEFTSLANKNIASGRPLSDFIHDDEIFEFLHSPEKIVSCNTAMADNVIMNSGKSVNITNYCYNDELINRFSPKIKDGRWLNISKNAQTIEVVVSENNYGWKVGDTLSVCFYNYPNSIILDVTIVGILEESSKIAGGFNVHNGEDNYNLFFSTYDLSIEEQPLLLFSSEYLANINSSVDIIQALFCSTIITYPDNISNEQLIEDQKN